MKVLRAAIEKRLMTFKEGTIRPSGDVSALTIESKKKNSKGICNEKLQ